MPTLMVKPAELKQAQALVNPAKKLNKTPSNIEFLKKNAGKKLPGLYLDKDKKILDPNFILLESTVTCQKDKKTYPTIAYKTPHQDHTGKVIPGAWYYKLLCFEDNNDSRPGLETLGYMVVYDMAYQEGASDIVEQYKQYPSLNNCLSVDKLRNETGSYQSNSDSSERYSGVGRALMEALVREIQAQGKETAFVNSAYNSAYFYRKIGFKSLSKGSYTFENSDYNSHELSEVDWNHVKECFKDWVKSNNFNLEAVSKDVNAILDFYLYYDKKFPEKKITQKVNLYGHDMLLPAEAILELKKKFKIELDVEPEITKTKVAFFSKQRGIFNIADEKFSDCRVESENYLTSHTL